MTSPRPSGAPPTPGSTVFCAKPERGELAWSFRLNERIAWVFEGKGILCLTRMDQSPGMRLMQANGDSVRFRQAVEGLLREIGSGGLSEILDSYLTDTRSRMEFLSQFLGAGDLPSLARCAHSIQGASAIFGLNDLKQAALEVELAAGLPDNPELFQLIGALRDRYADLEPELQATHATLLVSLPRSEPSEV